MSDYGAQYTARVQRGLEIRLQRLFTEAQSDMLKKLDGFTAQFREKDKRMLAKLEAGEIDKEKYDRWVAGQVFQGAQWEQKLNDMTDSLSDYYGEALDKIHDKQIDVFSKNSNYQAYCMEHDVGKNFGFDLYDADTVERLVKETPELLPRKIVDRKKHNHWNQGIINNCITQGVIQGESIPKIARRIANNVANADMKSATLYARTAMTSAQNGGRMERLKEAKDMGINVKKQWLAIVDGRTRDSHIHLDGQIRDVDKPFKSDFGRIDFPGDFKANPADVYNCRCTLVYVFPEYEDMSQYPDWEEAQKMTYPEWEKEKKQEQTDANEFGSAYDELGKYPKRPNAEDFDDYNELTEARRKYRDEKAKTEERVEAWFNRLYNSSISDEEFNKWCSERGVSVYGSLDGLDRKALKAYTERYDQLTKEFPQVMEWHGRTGLPFEISYTPTATWSAEATHGMNFGNRYDNLLDKVVSDYSTRWDGWFVKGEDPINAEFDHEFGHQLFDAIRRAGEEKTISETRMVLDIEEDFRKSVMGRAGSSEYSTSNIDESFAEAFSAWHGGEKTEFAVEFGKFLKRWGVI